MRNPFRAVWLRLRTFSNRRKSADVSATDNKKGGYILDDSSIANPPNYGDDARKNSAKPPRLVRHGNKPVGGPNRKHRKSG